MRKTEETTSQYEISWTEKTVMIGRKDFELVRLVRLELLIGTSWISTR